MSTYDKRDPLTYCANCQVEVYGETKPGSHGICARHAREVMSEAQRRFPVHDCRKTKDVKQKPR